MYKNNFKNEKDTTRVIFRAGWHNWNVDSIEEKTSKSGNPMFLVILCNLETYQTIECYLISLEGKQWKLMQFLRACGVEIDQDGNCEWNASSVVGRTIGAFVQNEENNFINREGKEIKGERSQISNFRVLEPTQQETPEEDLTIADEEEMF